MKPHDIGLYRQPGTPASHPSGAWAALAITRPDIDADTYVSRLWRLDPATGDLTPLTFGEKDSAPVISADGTWLAFLRGVDGKPQVAVARVNAAGLVSEPIVITDHHLGVEGGLAFNGTKLAYLAAVPEEGRYGTDEKVKPGQEPPRHITDFTYRLDGKGFYLDRPTQVFVIDVAKAIATDPTAEVAKADDVKKPSLEGIGTEPTQLTFDDAISAIEWHGDDLLAIRSRRNALADDLVRITPDAEVSVVEFPAIGGDAANGVWTPLAVSSTGTDLWLLVADLGPDEMDFIGGMGTLASARLEGNTLADFEVHTDHNVESLTSTAFAATDDGVYISRENRGTVELVKFAHGQITPIFDGPVVLSGLDVAGETMLAVAATATSIGEVYTLSGDAPSQITNLSARLVDEAGVFEPEEVVITGEDGYPVHGWVTTPKGEGPHPVLLLIHGGPHAAYTPAFFDEVQVYTAAGYAVVFCNPRGSSSYGRAHGRAITGVWGTLDAQDILTFLDGVLAQHGDLDGERVGVLGGSYGGYMTGWLTTQTDRWKGAIVERGFLDAFSFEGSSDIGWFFGSQYLGEDEDAVRAQNPMSHIDKVSTPTLVIHSEEDWRCPIEQGQRWFVGLKRRGVPAEFLVFSGEGHELSRSGTPKHRVARFEHILDWWSRYLPV